MRSRKTLFATGLLALMLVVFTSCDVQQSTPGNNTDRVKVSNDAEHLNERMEIVSRPLAGAKKSTVSEVSFRHLANVGAPTLRGETLSATGIHIRDNYAYVTYHLNGVDYGGALEIIDITDKNSPRIVSQLTIEDTDLNDVTVNDAGTEAFVAGGRKQSSSGYDTNGHNGAIAAAIQIRDDSVITSNMRETPLPSYSGNAIEMSGNRFAVSTGGTDGGFYELDAENFKVQQGIDRDLARHVDIENDKIIGLALNQGTSEVSRLYKFNSSTNTLDSLDTGLTVQPEDGKNVIDVKDGLVYTALSNRGYNVYDFNNPSGSVASFDLKGNGLANGLDVTEKYLFMAAGSEGLYVADLPNLNQVFSFDNKDGSANYVEANKSFIFLAKGINGFNILGINNDENTSPTACPFDESDGTVVNFANNRIRSERDEAASRTDLSDVSLPKGIYTVKLFGFDDHQGDGYDRAQQNQQHESFFVSLLKNGSEVATTGELGDLPDDSNLGRRITTLQNFELNTDVDQMRGVHAAYPAGGPNSLNAQCAAFQITK